MAKDIRFSPTVFNRDEDIHEEESSREFITFPLTDEEILKIAKSTSELDEQHKAIDAKFQQVKKDFKGQLDGLNSQMNYNFMLIKDECQDREVDCVKRKNFTRKVVQYLYDGKVMKERPMHDYELASSKNPNIQATLNGGSHHTV
jgi:predicted nuclease with TOPRIM domain